MKKILNHTAILLIALSLSSCAGERPGPVIYTPKRVLTETHQPVARRDTYHIVAPGETLWHLSRAYDVDLKDIAAANWIKTNTELKSGQHILIPNAAPVKPIIPLFPSDKWKYIIIHHTATDTGSALLLDKSHKNKGWAGLGYHFVINNNTEGKPDGHLESSLRWLRQENGAHCKASGMNEKGIGIAIVGNFSNVYVSRKQLITLVYTVNVLKKYYNIPNSNIMGHRDVCGANTECPGTHFPWQEFISRIDK
ncbi:MAG: N-acetylmuramoyl-L-alanine amidase [Candidatus Omnitrophica bacterium]|jgi:N-acetyl-anhydromuramyl-L-alanine amidase AmpD|nr:N-acetylmuramoyl-L-alanine amidase [Candidatus Omnitrophota bacterium]